MSKVYFSIEMNELPGESLHTGRNSTCKKELRLALADFLSHDPGEEEPAAFFRLPLSELAEMLDGKVIRHAEPLPEIY